LQLDASVLNGMDQNRAMVLTPPGVGAIALMRIVGPGTGRFLAQHFSRAAKEQRCVYGEIRDGEWVIDDGLVVLLDDGKGADVNVHGGTWVVQSVLRLLERDGFAVDRGGELPLCDDAVDAGTMLEREMLTHLPLARTAEALEILLAQPGVWTKFLDERPPMAALEKIVADEGLFWMLHPPRVAIVGAANVGKSTLANQLFARERSITADIAGTTRDWVGETANLDGLAVMLLDTPGLRQTHDPIERLAIERSAEQIESAELVVLVLDGSRELSKQAELVARFRDDAVVINKTDRALAWVDDFTGGIRTVATRGTGVEELRRAIRRRFGCEQMDASRPRWWTARQREVLRRKELGELDRAM
jgi:tRNA modification GTPase